MTVKDCKPYYIRHQAWNYPIPLKLLHNEIK